MNTYTKRTLKWVLFLAVAVLIVYLIVAGAWKLIASIVGILAAAFGLSKVTDKVKEEADAKAKEIQRKGDRAVIDDTLDRLRHGPPKTK
jgi:hypothetical protein